MHAATQKFFRIQHLHNDISIGHRWLVITETVANGSWDCAGAARPHLEEPAAVNMGDGAAACPDRMDVNHWHLQWVAMHDCLCRRFWPAFLDQRYIGRCAAHIEGDDVIGTDNAADFQCAYYARAGPRQDSPYGQGGRGFESNRATVRLGDVRRSGDAGITQPRGQL